MVERWPFKPMAVGSIPTEGVIGPLAQLVEHWSNKPRVTGSSPVRTIIGLVV